MKFETEFNIGDYVWGVDFTGKVAYGTITDFMWSKGKVIVFLDGYGQSCGLSTLATSKDEAIVGYVRQRLLDLQDEMNAVKEYAAINGIKLEK